MLSVTSVPCKFSKTLSVGCKVREGEVSPASLSCGVSTGGDMDGDAESSLGMSSSFTGVRTGGELGGDIVSTGTKAMSASSSLVSLFSIGLDDMLTSSFVSSFEACTMDVFSSLLSSSSTGRNIQGVRRFLCTVLSLPSPRDRTV